MMHENDKFEIPALIRKMSVSELRQEKERIYETLQIQKTTEARSKVAESPILFNV